jgi:hypothetical protein
MSEPDASTRRFLDHLRGGPESWSAVAFAPTDDDELDANAERRSAVLEMLLHDPRSVDRPLLRFLIQQEIQEAEHWWGLSEALRLATFLLAEHRHVDDVWLQWDAKNANFDTRSGLDTWPVLAGGVEATRALILASDHPDRGELLDDLALDPYANATDKDVQRWLVYQRTKYYQAPLPDCG